MQKLTLDNKIDLLSISRGTKKMSFSGHLDEKGCDYIKDRFDFLALDNVILSSHIKKITKDCWELKGNLSADIIQKCVVTGEPVKEKLAIMLEERYVLQNEDNEQITEIDADAVNVELLDSHMFDVGEFLSQVIGVESESFPKQEITPEVQSFGVEDNDHPFAKLAILKK
ncbi:DUF177 domain-containing protein [Alphaproteobacteria bacterium]|jgi:hypothetical protein|nr:hypothetical protein [Alphaproteobacteria bacterium]MDA9190298.1 DUF177 domain-containing protein [Alphaproteobacteria bacterium]MDC0395251.1 DUF177 domain-containing protein [Alphaproteobacteria bacterium]MDC0461503.1 DUF177 domain-containing protein [Alphaproteobacteria bacterium]